MLDRELSYQMPFKRLMKVSRMASRRAFAGSWRLLFLLVAAYFVAFGLIIAFPEPVADWLADHNLPAVAPIFLLLAAFFAGFWLLRRHGVKQMKQRADYDGVVRFREEQDGLRFATSDIDYLVKWRGLSQMILVETDGVLFSHGSLYFLVPIEAFHDTKERNELVRDVFARLSEEARERSGKYVPADLQRPAGTTMGA